MRKQRSVIGWELRRQLRSPGRGCCDCCCSSMVLGGVFGVVFGMRRWVDGVRKGIVEAGGFDTRYSTEFLRVKRMIGSLRRSL